MLLDLAVILVAAKLAAEACERVAVPAVVGEIVAGIVIGPSVLGWVPADSESIVTLAELGVLLLLVQVGMEMDLAELGRVGRASTLVAIVGVAVPFAAGAATGLAFGESGDTALFIGAALTATSVGITARVFGDLRALATTEARIVLGAAVADDVLGLIILTVVVKIVTEGSVGVGTVLGTIAVAVGFLAVASVAGAVAVPWAFARIGRVARSGATVVVVAFAATLALAWAATWAKLAAIIGAFVAGIAIGRSAEHGRVEREFGATANLLIPVFFVQIGLDTELEAMARPEVLGLAGALVAVAIAGKLVSAVGAAGVVADRAVIGIGMIPRGEVGLIFASIGLAEGVLGDDQYAALLIMVLLTTLVTPPLLRARLGRAPAEHVPAAGTGRWELARVGDRIVLRGDPDPTATVPIAIEAARAAVDAAPDTTLIDWFGRHRRVPLTWTPADTDALVELLRVGDARSWRLLDVTGVLERALPEVAAALTRRRSDPGELDPTRVLQLPTVQAVGPDADRLGLLAALVADVCDTGPPGCRAALAERLDPEAAADVVAVVDGAALLHGAIGDPDAFDDTRVLQLAEHVSARTVAWDAYRLAAARLDAGDWRRQALDELYRRIEVALARPELDGVPAATPAAARRLAALGALGRGDELARLRLDHAPTTFLLANEPGELARQARLVEPLAPRGVLRVAVTPDPEPGRWRIDVAGRDHARLLARLTRVLADRGLDVVSASLATWPDGGVLDSFVVVADGRPSARELAREMERSLRGRLRVPRVEGLAVTFDDGTVPWHTLCTITVPDRPGTLAAIAAAFAAARVDVHAARISTDPATRRADLRFEVTDRSGHKLDARRVAAVRAALGA